MQPTRDTYDAVVIGSGFGGSVMSCRLAEKGYSVLLLERGRRYGYGEFPRRSQEVRQIFWDPEDGMTGLYELDFFADSDSWIACASGLGGGSLIYGNVLAPMPADYFRTWPGGIDRGVMDPFYGKVLTMMEASPYPFESDPFYAATPKTRGLKAAFPRLRASGACGAPEWSYPPLAIRFEGEFPGAQSRNRQGVVQSRCTKCGNCTLGCNIRAKNTLDLNYLAAAEKQGAEIRTEAEVIDLRPADGGYQVVYRHPLDRDATASVVGRRVVLSAGSYGSTALLLRLKRDGSLPELSPCLGEGWCGNGDVEATILGCDEEVDPTVGPTITTAISYRCADYEDGFPHGFCIEDGGVPPAIGWFLIGKLPSPGFFSAGVRLLAKLGLRYVGVRRVFRGPARLWRRLRRRLPETSIGDDVIALLDREDTVRRALVLFCMGRDRSTGRLYIDDDGQVQLDWRMRQGSKLHFERMMGEAKALARELGGRLIANPITYLDKVIAVHPLGGCVMAESEEQGVVDLAGQVYRYPGLYVVDGSILPTSTGVNPSATIAANAERIASAIPPAAVA